MNQHRFTSVMRSLSSSLRNRPSRRDVLHGLTAAVGGLGLTALLSVGETEAASCEKRCKQKAKKKDWSKKKKQACLQKCTPLTSPIPPGTPSNPSTPSTPSGGKTAGTLCGTTGECAGPNICEIPVNDSGGDKRCCAPAGAPCGLKNPENDDDTSPFCCRGNTCTSTSTEPGTCQPTPDD
jgi:hypothetical protein